MRRRRPSGRSNGASSGAAPVGRPDRQPPTRRERRWADSHRGVRAGAAQHKGLVEAAAHGEIRAQAGGRHTKAQEPAVRQVERRVERRGTVVHVQRSRCAGDADPHGPFGPDREAAQEHLQCRRTLGVAEQPVGQPERPSVGRAAAGHADGRVSGAAEILDESERTDRLDDERGHLPTSTKRTRRPGVSSAGGSRSASHNRASLRPMSCQPPGDGRG